jgi:hypothetical protein
MPRPAAAKMRTPEMPATKVSTSTSHPAAEMTAPKVTASAKMSAAAVTATTMAAAASRIGRTRNHDGKKNNGQEIEL